jgi:putative ABC transport system permease protein
MNDLRLAWQMLLRDFRAGELHLLGIAMLIAVASVTSVSFFTDRLSQALTREANQLLGGDLLLVADHPWPPEFEREAARIGLSSVTSVSFVSMASSAAGAQLSGVKAVQPGYPLRGALRIAPGLNQPDAQTRETPARGTAWLDERLTTALGVKPGDSVTLGNSRFSVGAVLTFESDRGMNFFSLVPRFMMNAEDLPATGLIQVGSRVSYRLHVSGEPKQVSAFRAWALPKLARGEQLEDISNARPEVRSALERAQEFLRLAALLAVVLAAVAVGLSARRFMQRHLDGCAVMRCLGARQSQVLRLYLGEFLIFGAASAALGCALGYVTQWVLELILGDLLSARLPQPTVFPVLYGYAVGLALLAGFVVPQLLRLGRVPTLRVLRREFSGSEPVTVASYGAGVAALALLMLWMAGDLKLGLIVLGGFAAAVATYAGVARVLLVATGRLRGSSGSGWRYGLASMRRRLGGSIVQVVAVGLGMTALLLLTVTREDLLSNWRQSVPPDAPNRFVINIQPDQLEAVRSFFVGQGLREPELEPMVRGRLATVNDRPVSAADFDEERARRLVEREFNLSWAARIPVGNSIAQGAWFDAGEGAHKGYSVESGLANTLGLKLGDRLSFEIAGNRIEAPITSLRRLDWDSMRVNFFVIAPPGALDALPVSYITSFHLPQEREDFVRALVSEFPNLTLIDVAAVVRQLQRVLDQLARAVQFIFAFALLAGIVVLFAGLEATHDERRFELAVMRTLGARNAQMRAALATEFAALGAAAGLLAVAGAVGIGEALAHFVFKLPYQPGWLGLALGVTAGLLGIMLAGLAGMRRTLRVPAIESLRQMA